MTAATLVSTPGEEPSGALIWDDDVPQKPDEEPLDLFLARQLLRSRFPDFDGKITNFVLVAMFESPDGTRSVAQTASRHTHYAIDRGLLETALDEYRNLGVVSQMPDDDEEDEDDDAEEA